MGGIGRVLNRIADIQRRFAQPTGGVSMAPATTFNDALMTAQTVQISNSPGSTGTGSEVADIIRFSALRQGVDPKLAISVAQVESGLSADAVSPAGAVGVMQLMPETAKSLGVGNSFDPRENVDGGVRYLKQLLTNFNGDVVKTIAAYNAGPAAVEKYNGVPPYSETRNYVEKVLALFKANQ